MCNKYKKHLFWDKQPVSRVKLNKEGTISINPRFNIILEDNMILKDIDVISEITAVTSFINTHFSDTYIYPTQFLKESLQYLNNKKVFNIGLYLKKQLIGFIHAKPVIIYCKEIIDELYYVDFLCVHKEYRNKNIAVLLISSLINKLGKTQKYIFKKEKNPLPFNYINKTSYYFMDTRFISVNPRITNNIVTLNKSNIQRVYEFITKIKNKRIAYDIISEDEFTQLYLGRFKKVFIETDTKDNILSVLTYIHVQFSQSPLPLKTIDIESIYIDDMGDNIQIFDHLIQYAKQNDVNIISCIDQIYNKYFIDKFKMLKSMELYFHMYNFHINDTIANFNMAFNVL